MSSQKIDDLKKNVDINHVTVNINISEISLLVPLAKSKKLAAIRKRLLLVQTVENNPLQTEKIQPSGQDKQHDKLLKDAQGRINTRISNIMACYPPGKKIRMFTVRYGSLESIKQMNMKAIFKHLSIEKTRKFVLIESLDYFGNETASKKTGSNNPLNRMQYA